MKVKFAFGNAATNSSAVMTMRYLMLAKKIDLMAIVENALIEIDPAVQESTIALSPGQHQR